MNELTNQRGAQTPPTGPGSAPEFTSPVASLGPHIQDARRAWFSRTSVRHFRGGGGSEAHFRTRGGAVAVAAAAQEAGPGTERPTGRRTHGRVAGSHGAQPRGQGTRARAVSSGTGAGGEV
jgi:hypothetical protein